MNISFQKNYNTYLIQELDNTAIGEIEVFLNDTPESNIGYLLIDKGVTGKEETIFYHRKSGNSVFCYGVNRSNPVLHDTNSQVLLANAIDALNYLADASFDQFFMYKKSTKDLIITGGKIFKDGSLINILDLDTETGGVNQVLITNATNYIYLEGDIINISDIYNNTKYNLGEVDVDVSGNITAVRHIKALIFNSVNFGELGADTVIDGRIATQKGQPNGLATLNGIGEIPSSQLPSYVDDVIEVANYAALPLVGETGKIYVTLDTNLTYRWSGSSYVEITDTTAVWGNVSGILSNQTDLQNALDGKVSDTGNEIINGEKTFNNTAHFNAITLGGINIPIPPDIKFIAGSSITKGDRVNGDIFNNARVLFTGGNIEVNSVSSGAILGIAKVNYTVGQEVQFMNQAEWLDFITGDSSDGDLIVSSGTTTLNTGRVYNYNNVDIQAGATINTVDASGFIFMKVKGTCNIDGLIELSGITTLNQTYETGIEGISVAPGIPGNAGNGGFGGNGGYHPTYGSAGTRGNGGIQGSGYGGGGGGGAHGSGQNGLLHVSGDGGAGGTPGGVGGSTSSSPHGGTSAGGYGGYKYGGGGSNSASSGALGGDAYGNNGGTSGYGSGGGGGAGGKAGVNGACLVIICDSVITGTGTINTNGLAGTAGGNGGNGWSYSGGSPTNVGHASGGGGGGGGGGGAGGAGGSIHIVGPTTSLTQSVSQTGGAGGAGGTGGAGGIPRNFDGQVNGTAGAAGGPGSVGNIGSITYTTITSLTNLYKHTINNQVVEHYSKTEADAKFLFGKTVNNYTASGSGGTPQYTSEVQSVGQGFAYMKIYWRTGNATNGLAASIQTSPDGITWTTIVYHTFGMTTLMGYTSCSCIVPDGYYVRGYAGGSDVSNYTDVTLTLQDNS